MNPLSVGSIVRLKSGGPDMTVTEITDGVATCTWLNGEQFESAPFALGTLDVVPGDSAEDQKPYVPTREEVLAAGYGDDAADAIIAGQKELLDAWTAAHPVVEVACTTTYGTMYGFTCPSCRATQNSPVTEVECQCGCLIKLVPPVK